MTVAIASHNPAKIKAVQKAFSIAFPEHSLQFESLEVASGVPDQPWGDEQTLKGAQNRVQNAQEICTWADCWVGIEGGIEKRGQKIFAFAWVVCQSKSHRGEARSAAFELPEAIQLLLEEGQELGTANDKVFGVSNSKKNKGAIGLLTSSLIERNELYMPAVIMSLIPHLNPQYYPSLSSTKEAS